MADNRADVSDEQDGDRPADTAGRDDGPADEGTDFAAEAAKWKALARKHEDRAKVAGALQRELDGLKQSAMSDQEKAVVAAREDGLRAGRAELSGRLVGAEFRALAAGRTVNGEPLDVAGLLEDIDPARYVGEDGEVDADRVARFLDRVAPKPKQDDTDPRYRGFDGQLHTSAGGFGQGRRAPERVSGAAAGLAEAERRFGKATTAQ